MTQGLITAAYIVAAAFFIASLAGLSQQETARRGNWLGILALFPYTTLFRSDRKSVV